MAKKSNSVKLAPRCVPPRFGKIKEKKKKMRDRERQREMGGGGERETDRVK